MGTLNQQIIQLRMKKKQNVVEENTRKRRSKQRRKQLRKPAVKLNVTPRLMRTIQEGIGEARIMHDAHVHDLQREGITRVVRIPKEGELVRL